MDSSSIHSSEPVADRRAAVGRERLLFVLAMLIVLVTGVYFRYTGLMWGDYEYAHPDERFLVWVTADISPVKSLGAYFDTATSSLNPANRGHTFYVYGDFPVIATRYLAEAIFPAVGWQEILQVGRAFSALCDLITVLLVFLTAARLFGWQVGMLAGLFSAGAVLQIQQSHFYTTDSFSTVFSMLVIYLCVLIASTRPRPLDTLRRFEWNGLLGLGLGVGIAVGLAMACKINTILVAGLLPVALILFWLRLDPRERLLPQRLVPLVVSAVAAGALAFLVFRAAQPYAFAGPGFTDIRLDPGWLGSIRALQAQSTGDVDFPPALQWARRPMTFSFTNMVLWGLGIPLGLLAWAGFLWMGYRLLRCLLNSRDGLRGWAACLLNVQLPGSLVLWGWTAVYFAWQSTSWNPTMRYQLPVYPTLAILAAWLIGDLWNNPRLRLGRLRFNKPRAWRAGVAVLGALVLLLTLVWAFAFTRIYVRTETRVAATHWIFQNVPGPVNLQMNAADGAYMQLLSLAQRATVRAGLPYQTFFIARQAGTLTAVQLPRVIASSAGDPLRLQARVFDPQQPDQPLATGSIDLPANSTYDTLRLPLNGLAQMEAGRQYELSLELVEMDGQSLQTGGSGWWVDLDGTLSLSLYGAVQQLSYQQTGSLETVMVETNRTLREVHLPPGSGVTSVTILVLNPLTGEQQVAQATSAQAANFPATGQVLPGGYTGTPDETLVLNVDPQLVFKAGTTYQVAITSSTPGQVLLPGQQVTLAFLDQPASLMLPDLAQQISADAPLWTTFAAQKTGILAKVTLAHAVQVDPAKSGQPTSLLFALTTPADPGKVMASARLSADLSPGNDPRGQEQVFNLDTPVALQQGQTYTVQISTETGGLVQVRGSAPANESTWDMGLPFRMDGYDPYGGIYRNDLNFEMYWDDTEDKRQRFLNNLDQGDYIFMSSNRQWGTTTRVPERYALTTTFYRELLGCPADKEVQWCYNVAEPGTFQGTLGYELVQVFTSYPNLGPVEINDQFAEEAFTVYDHPKVMIFKKTAAYDLVSAASILNAVDLSQAVRITPRKASSYKNMLLTAGLWAQQQAGGTWAKLFPPGGLLNRYPVVALIVYYLFMTVFGILFYPILRLALPGLPDRGYPFGRIAAMVVFGYLAWIGGSLEVTVSRLFLLILILGLAAAGLGLGYLQRREIAQEWADRRSYFLTAELVGLGFFLLCVILRLGNPDLWHPIYGGEKPMNFSFFNAVLKSSVFPPYDPWFAGGSMNYYYYGYVIIGMPIKLLGIDPGVAYNLVLPMLFCVIALAAFSIAVNITAGLRRQTPGALLPPTPEPCGPTSPRPEIPPPARLPIWAGLIAAAALLIFGNMGTARMFWQGWQKIVVSEQVMQSGSIGDHFKWASEGFFRWVSGNPKDLPYYPGDWYWKPSRAIQPELGSEITEFPFFTFTYADLHAHLMALPITMLVIAWALALVLGCGRWGSGMDRLKRLSLGLALLLGALAAGALRPANTWDQYTYLLFASIALFYSQVHAAGRPGKWLRSFLRAGVMTAALVALALLLYRPFDQWFAQAYNSVIPWLGARTNLSSYLVHWGLFLFIIFAWVFDETVDWMEKTPLSALGRLRTYQALLGIAVVIFFGVLGLLILKGVVIAALAIPLGAWVLVLLFRPDQPEAKRFVLFMIGTAVALTLMVELVAVKGDNARMNTVFKFYYQAWTLFSLSAAAAFWWLMAKLPGWNATWRKAWLGFLGVLVFFAVLFPITATRAKWTDRLAPNAPRELDGMAYMKYASYGDGLTTESYRQMDLSQDYRAIQWVRANVPGSPVIVEANTPEYRHWGSRFTIYTGLPGVVGWNWHERQQRALTPDTWIYTRIDDIRAFYATTSREQAEDFLRRYNVKYIVFGQLERIYYDGPGLGKFAELNGVLWDRVYGDEQTEIYKVK